MTSGGGLFTVVDGMVDHLVNFDAAPAVGTVMQAIVVLQATDELTGAPVMAPISVDTQVVGLTPAAAGSGFGGLIGVPMRVFPSLATQTYTVDLTVRAPGYVPWNRTATVPMQALGSFVAVDLGTVLLHRLPVNISVSTVSLNAQNQLQPLAGALVRVSAMWRRVADLTGAGVVANLISLPLGISQTWPVGTALDSVSLLGAVEPTRSLARAAAPGERTLGVDILGALVAGDIVGLDTADLGRREYLPVTAIDPTQADSPAVLHTGSPVRTPHARLSAVRRVPAPPGAPADANLTVEAAPGDTTVFVDTVGPFAPVENVRASGAGLTDEYLDSHLFWATTDGTGFARLPALSRIAAVELTATKGALTATARFSPNYSSPANSVVLILR